MALFESELTRHCVVLTLRACSYEATAACEVAGDLLALDEMGDELENIVQLAVDGDCVGLAQFADELGLPILNVLPTNPALRELAP